MSIKSELSKTASHLRRARQSIIGRGGQISLTAGLKDLPQAIFNIPADASLAHYTDGDIAYRKSVPAGAEKYALLKSIGGMTYKCNNHIPYPYTETTKTSNGITFTDNGDGSISVKGIATGNASFYMVFNVKIDSLIAGKTYVPSTSATKTILMCNYVDNAGTTKNFTTTQKGAAQYPNDAVTDILYLLVTPGTTVDETVYPMLNEGTTALPYEPFYEGLRDSKTTEVISYRADGGFISTKPIPKALQDIDGYGRGINADCYSYADWGEKQFVNRVGVAVFDGSTDERWYTTPSLDKTDYKAYYISQYAANGHKTSGGEAICDKLSILTTTELYQSNIGGFYMGNVADKQIVIRVPNSIADVSALRTWLSQNPLTLYYELAESIITDISNILTDDNFIEVESGGALEFVNEYQNAVPSTVKYTVKVGS